MPDAAPPAGGMAGGAESGTWEPAEMTLPGVGDAARDDLRAAVGRADGDTAHAAARSMSPPVLSAQRYAVAETLVLIAGRYGIGATAHEIAQHLETRSDQNVVARRLADLEELDVVVRHRHIRRAGRSGRPLTVWLPTPRARQVVLDA